MQQDATRCTLHTAQWAKLCNEHQRDKFLISWAFLPAPGVMALNKIYDKKKTWSDAETETNLFTIATSKLNSSSPEWSECMAAGWVHDKHKAYITSWRSAWLADGMLDPWLVQLTKCMNSWQSAWLADKVPELMRFRKKERSSCYFGAGGHLQGKRAKYTFFLGGGGGVKLKNDKYTNYNINFSSNCFYP